MSLTIGVDTYIDIAGADKYVQENYAHRTDILTKWGLLTTTEKESLLRSSTAAIDRAFIPRGCPCKRSQPLKFPRFDMEYFGGPLGVYSPDQIYDTTFIEVSGSEHRNGFREAAESTVENSIAAMIFTETAQQVQNNSILGLTSKKLGPIAESYSTSHNAESIAAQYGIYAYHKITRIMRDWITGNIMTL